MHVLLPTILFGAVLASGATDLDALLREVNELHARCTKPARTPDAATRRRIFDVMGKLSEDGSARAVEGIARFFDVPSLEASAIDYLRRAKSREAGAMLEEKLLEEESAGRAHVGCLRVTILRRCSEMPNLFAADTLATVLRTDRHPEAVIEVLQYADARFSTEYARIVVDALDGKPRGAGIGGLDKDQRQSLFVGFLTRGLAALEERARLAATGADDPSLSGAGRNASPRELRKEVARISSGLLSTAADGTKSTPARTVCLLALAERAHRPAADAALDILQQEKVDPTLSSAAAALAAKVADERARPRVYELLKQWTRSPSQTDELETEVVALLDAATTLAVEEAAPIVKKLSRSRNLYLRAAAVAALPLLGAEKARRALKEALRNRSWQVRRAAIEGCRRLANRAAVDLLIERMPREEGRLRYDLLVALVHLTGVSMPYVEADWKKWWGYNRQRYEPPGEERTEAKRTIIVTPANPKSKYFGLEVISQRLCFIADVSGSMNAPLTYDGQRGSCIDVLKQQVLKLVESLDKKTRFNIYFFETSYKKLFRELVPLTRRNYALVRGFVKQRKADGGTNLYDPLENALLDPDVDTIYILSDGAPSAGKHTTTDAILDAVRRINRRRRIQINTISIGGDSQLMRRLASRNEGEYRVIR